MGAYAAPQLEKLAMNILSMQKNAPVERSFDVWRYKNSVKTYVGVVRATHHTYADRKAVNLYGHGVWTTERN
jgi:hypothetical protein